jgi:hypothetical protein
MSHPKYLFIALVLIACVTVSERALAKNSVDYSNSGGMLKGSNNGLALTGSTLIAITTFPGGSVTGDLGTVSFSTGALVSGSLQMGGMFASGGSFAIDGNGTDGITDGVLFSGSFTGPVTWTLTTLANGTHNYILTAVVTGTMGSTSVSGVTVQLSINTGKGYFDGSTLISGGDTTMTSSVPEPSTLALVTIGAISMFGKIRQRLVRQDPSV